MTRKNCFTSLIQYEIKIFVNRTYLPMCGKKPNSFSDPILGVYVKKNHLENITEIERSSTGGSVHQFYVY